MTNYKTPHPVIQEAKMLVEMYGENFGYVGKYQGKYAFLFLFPENVETGFPFLYLYDDKDQSVCEIAGPDALDIIDRI